METAAGCCQDDRKFKVYLEGSRNNDLYKIGITMQLMFAHSPEMTQIRGFFIELPVFEYKTAISDILEYLLNRFSTKENVIEWFLHGTEKDIIMDQVSLKRTCPNLYLKKSEPIAVFTKHSNEYKRLEAAAALVQAETHCSCIVDNTMFDYGQNWEWTTLILEHKSSYQSVQLLNPKQQKIILYGNTAEWYEIVTELIAYVKSKNS